MINKHNLREVAELRIWAYMNPFYWALILIILIIVIILTLSSKVWVFLRETYTYYSVPFARRKRVEKFVKSYYDCPLNHKALLLDKRTRAGRKLRRFTYKNIMRLKQLDRIKNEQENKHRGV